MFACTMGFSYMAVFMAGQMIIGAVVAITTVESISSAMPAAILPMILAVAGAITKTLAFWANEMWRMSS
jgi:hypothetical protein